MKNVAIVPARGLGDGLIYMTLAQSFLLSKTQVTVFSSPLCELKSWFPDHKILPFPAAADFSSTFSSFDTVIADSHSILNDSSVCKNHLIILNQNTFDKKKSFVENLLVLANMKFSLNCKKENGIKPPQGLVFRKFPKRVVIHPTSSELSKNWMPEKFFLLEMKLKELGFEPYFCVSPHERKIWPQSPLFPQIQDVASFIYESGYMIGNDSGLGHLASCLNIPTLSLFARKNYSNLWRPGFGMGCVVCAPNFLFGSRLKQKYWKQALSCKRVINAFQKLVKRYENREKNASASFSQIA